MAVLRSLKVARSSTCPIFTLKRLVSLHCGSDPWVRIPLLPKVRGYYLSKTQLINILERALRALASSSGGAACPGGTRGQPRKSTQGVRG